jgi:hypothetical protein
MIQKIGQTSLLRKIKARRLKDWKLRGRNLALFCWAPDFVLLFLSFFLSRIIGKFMSNLNDNFHFFRQTISISVYHLLVASLPSLFLARDRTFIESIKFGGK